MLRPFTEFSICKSEPLAQFTGRDLVFLLEKSSRLPKACAVARSQGHSYGECEMGERARRVLAQACCRRRISKFNVDSFYERPCCVSFAAAGFLKRPSLPISNKMAGQTGSLPDRCYLVRSSEAKYRRLAFARDGSEDSKMAAAGSGWGVIYS
ncbi:hypothetical protein EVAR_95871_1 [Eumeta japonica]|uniref:Uncharacterized protein n=1 Tax=Eumeta variegata TaxID=151549 RepID=A0A4C1VMN8_EUMVA|nr:hypothetical protein EVAR_95871_1 [Eumeta japonica]